MRIGTTTRLDLKLMIQDPIVGGFLPWEGRGERHRPILPRPSKPGRIVCPKLFLPSDDEEEEKALPFISDTCLCDWPQFTRGQKLSKDGHIMYSSAIEDLARAAKNPKSPEKEYSTDAVMCKSPENEESTRAAKKPRTE